ncbi:hypothetical protein H5410_041570 [Solanum commersonii]|uniref:Uncharacterized protein n=1 Tax=Solanum commersonii TaxID=4109 RepID=A0A9J5XV42_SOLCO|nr:hypothetical protein H5410_041570 [Solanum commersonii]
MIISKNPCLRKSPRHANVPKRPKSPLSKRQTKQCANVTSYTGIKKNVEINQVFLLKYHPPTSHLISSPAGHSGFSPLGQQFNTPEPQDLLNVICDQTEKMEEKEFTDINKSGSSDANKLIVEQMVHDDQSNLNPERSMVLHPLLTVDEHTPLPIPRERHPGPFNISPYVTSFRSESGSSSRFPFTFDLKHPFVSMSDVDLKTLYMHF